MENPQLDPTRTIEHSLTKKRSRRRIEFVTNEDDDWFIFVNYIEKSSNKVVDEHVIIRKDKETWLRSLTGIRGGWIEEKG